MLNGLIEPTAGQCIFDGIDVLQDVEKFRENLGYCP